MEDSKRALEQFKDVGLFTVIHPDGSSDPKHDPFLDEATLLKLYRGMLLIRRVDERMLAKQRQGKVGFYGTITGQEATPVALGLASHSSDWIFPALRESAAMLLRGFPLSTWLAQVYGNDADVNKGRQMPSHMSGKSVNQVSWSSCIGPQLPQAVGAAYAMKKKAQPSVAYGFCGDGATSQGDFHIAMNFASKWNVPALIICQNNHWSISVPTERQTIAETIAMKARLYGIPGLRIDGNDVVGLYTAIKKARQYAVDGHGPCFIECLTYRIGPHSSSDDPTRYRANSEVETWKMRDPILRMERHLTRAQILTETVKTQIEEGLEHDISQAIMEVEERPLPELHSLITDVYKQVPLDLEHIHESLKSLEPYQPHGG